MSRRANGTNRAAMLVSGSRYTGYARPKKKAVSLAELNGRLKNKTHPHGSKYGGKKQDGK